MGFRFQSTLGTASERLSGLESDVFVPRDMARKPFSPWCLEGVVDILWSCRCFHLLPYLHYNVAGHSKEKALQPLLFYPPAKHLGDCRCVLARKYTILLLGSRTLHVGA